jgi:hypothetical protein
MRNRLLSESEVAKLQEIRNEYGFTTIFAIDNVKDIYSDTFIGRCTVAYNVDANKSHRPLFNDKNICSINYEVNVIKNILTWIELWSIADSIVRKFNLDVNYFNEYKIVDVDGFYPQRYVYPSFYN